MAITEADLTEAGRATNVDGGGIDGTIVYRLRGVDPSDAVVMRMVSGSDVPYLLFRRRGSTYPPKGLCQYLTGVDREGCPPEQPAKKAARGLDHPLAQWE